MHVHLGAIIRVIVLVLVVAALMFARGRMAKYVQPDGRVIVRCSAGHFFETLWLPFGSLKAVRLGNVRYQHCPVGRHWAMVRPVDPATLSGDELAQARSVTDIPIP